MENIRPESLYEVDLMEPEEIQALERAGFRWAGEAVLYHPDHWEHWNAAALRSDEADTWLYEEEFRARTPAARDWLVEVEV